jgi:hypothetical protein
LIVVTALAVLVLIGALVVVVCKTRTSRRHVTGTTIRDQAEEGACRGAHTRTAPPVGLMTL